jgi:complex III assembly factor LYRM7
MSTFDKDPAMFHQVRIEARKKIMENASETDPLKI